MTIAKMIDHTALKPDTTKEQILTLTKKRENTVLLPYA